MFIDRLLNQGSTPLVERMMRFTSARHELLAENFVNASTPGYQQKDLSVSAFQKAMRDRVEMRSSAGPGAVRFDDITMDVQSPRSGLLFHDRNNRSMEQLQTDLASNALKHNMYTELLRKRFEGFESILKERI